ncbi:hypothetical protein PG996_000369 [Apiospora saccharicola]|uniref:Uncharacterized protein n=1 Tax=Apiospora saccharicola TaxID=335842 RepID=A0ABR1WHN4_9PEZI
MFIPFYSDGWFRRGLNAVLQREPPVRGMHEADRVRVEVRQQHHPASQVLVADHGPALSGEQQTPPQITYFNSGSTASASRRLDDWLDQSAEEDASSIPMYPPPIYPTYPAFFRPVVYYHHHISGRLLVESPWI